MRIRFLKVKIKSLAEEARIIRREEQKTSGTERARLHEHRVTTVRNAARQALIAYQLIREKNWNIHSREDVWGYDVKEVLRMARKYGGRKYERLTLEKPAKAA